MKERRCRRKRIMSDVREGSKEGGRIGRREGRKEEG